jgi:hypothetical protein
MHRQVKHTPPVPDLFTTRGDGSFAPPLKRDGMIKNIDGRCVDLNRILSVSHLVTVQERFKIIINLSMSCFS